MVPEIYHEFLPKGTVLGTDMEGKTKGNDLKKEFKMENFDKDVSTLINTLKSHQKCNGRIGVLGFCIGGHLALRAALDSTILASACFYATDLHLPTGSLVNNTLERINEIKGELLLAWGRQDPHIPSEGRLKIYQHFQKWNGNYTWHEFNTDHSFMTDEDPSGRFAPGVTDNCFSLIFELFNRHL